MTAARTRGRDIVRSLTADALGGKSPVSRTLQTRHDMETGSQNTQPLGPHIYEACGLGTRSAQPVGMNSDANETACGTCGLLLYGTPFCVMCEREVTYTRTIAALTAPKGAKGAYKVLLASIGNPDFGQDSRRSLPGVPRQTLCVTALADASRVCRAYIEHYELGGGNWRGGEVKKGATVIAQISYNGRAWEPGTWPAREIPLAKDVA